MNAYDQHGVDSRELTLLSVVRKAIEGLLALLTTPAHDKSKFSQQADMSSQSTLTDNLY